LIERLELHVNYFTLTDVSSIERMLSAGVRIKHLGVHAIFFHDEAVSIFHCICFFSMSDVHSLVSGAW
jgi:hypothetical protein